MILPRRSLLAAPAVLLASRSLAQVPMTGAGKGTPGGGGGAGTTWNPATASAGITLSNGNLTAANPSSGATDEFVYSINTSTGKFYFEVVVNTDAGGSNNIGIGVADTSFTGSIFLGGDLHAISYYNSSGQPFYGASAVGTYVSYTTGDNVGVAMDVGGKTFWARKNGGFWNNSATDNPAIGMGGTPVASIGGTCRAAADLRVTQGSQITAKFGSGSFTYSIPSGFSPL